MSQESNSLELGFDLDALLSNGKGGGYRKVKTEYLKEGVAFYRILPSFDATDRRINFEYYMHWITGEGGQKMKVLCTKGTEGYCPLCEASKAQEQLFERLKTDPNADKERLKMLEENARNLRASKSIYFNAVNQQGEVVVLELNTTVVKLLANKMEKAKELGFDPTHPKTGAWFRFSKKGKGRDAFEVDFKKITVTIDGEMLEKNDRTALTDEQIASLPTSVHDLKNAGNMYIQTFTAKELADFVRGTPLKSKFQKKAKTEGSDSQAFAAQESAPAQQQSAPAAAASAPAGSGSVMSEVERLRNLSRGQ